MPLIGVAAGRPVIAANRAPAEGASAALLGRSRRALAGFAEHADVAAGSPVDDEAVLGEV